jgi:hypothetical protein
MIRRTAQLTAAAAGALLLLSACGGSSTSDVATDAAAASSTSAAAAGGGDMTAYRDCLADNGVTLPDFVGGGAGGFPSGMPTDMPSGMPTGAPPSGGPAGGGFPGGGLPEGVDQETFDAAQGACASLAPQGGFGQRGPGGGAQIDETAVAAYKSCLTDNDVTIAEGDDWMASLDRTDEAVQSAMETCSVLLPTPAASPSS